VPVDRAFVAVERRSRARLVVLRALGMGDLLTSVPALRALARAYPDHWRLLAAPRALWPLVELIDSDGDPAIHEILDVGPLAPLRPVVHEPDVAVNLHGRGPESHRILEAVAPRRVIWFENVDVPASRGAPIWRSDEHEVKRWCRLLSEHGLPADPRRLELSEPGAAPGGLEDATIVHPGAASPARRWPADRFAQVARAEADRGRRVIVTGGPNERALVRSVARAAGLSTESALAGQTDLGALARVVAAAGRVICGDTGIGHLATALGTPSVLLFGPTPPGQWGPPRDREQHRVLWAGTQGDPHARRPDDGLLKIGPDQVLTALDSLPLAR
jgi:ADP-heptose:LPS heptosyltransferase